MATGDPMRGEVWDVDLDPVKGHEQAGKRPALIVSADRLNASAAGLLIVLPITTKDKQIPLHVKVAKPTGGVSKDSYVIPEQVRSISRGRLVRRRGKIDAATMAKVEDHLRIVLDLL
ncbi:type II toxin-antitoxin system PemK/MazF family toxin [Aeoliella sp. SH292]|uniref:type II toxin-antitoxin system PemK/MazF family toxin n=1 Tax=Aeoliella sp. SH292 TaxID=3454464 RepID=UPI003F95DE1D